ncbi:MAG: methionyl-tRNA formyltransferase [Burkholderiaceae bacterium]
MKIIFAGTPEFARVALERLHRSGFDVALVLSQPDRPAGRGMKLLPSPVKQFALAQGIPVAQPRSLRLDGRFPEDARAARERIMAVNADAMVVAAYGLLLPQWVLDAPAQGCLNIHASLLPRWRGAAPIHRAIEAGDAQTGVTIMQMDAGLDTGDMLLREPMAIAPSDTTGTLHDKLAALGARLAVEALELAACGGLRAERQPEAGVTYASKIEKAEAAIDWHLSAQTIALRVRAFNPAPGAVAWLGGEAIKVWAALPLPAQVGAGPVGEVMAVDAQGVHVRTGAGLLCLTELQRAGGKRLPVADFLRGFPVVQGQCLDAPSPATKAG